jgi:multiple sugar transport system ATP-binding protein
MKGGIIQQVDTPLNLYNNPVNKFVAGFIGSPAMNFVDGKICTGNNLKFVSNKESLVISFEQSQKEKLASYTNKNVTIGIRPESFTVEPVSDNKVEVIIDIVEQMGSESLLYFDIDGSQFTARSKADTKIRFGDKITLYVKSDTVKLFASL